MKILITGAYGFIGKNLTAELKNRSAGSGTNSGIEEVFLCGRETSEEELKKYTSECDFVFHLAGVNRPKKACEFMEGNRDFTEKLATLLSENEKRPSILMSSSIQAGLNNPYGESKKAGEEVLFDYHQKTGAMIYLYRLPNVFGKWCRPEYNSVVATFCHHIANGLPIKINDPTAVLSLVYIDDVIKSFMDVLKEDEILRSGGIRKDTDILRTVPVSYTTTLKELADIIYSFPETRKNITVPNMENELLKKLYSTYLSYLPENEFSYPLNMHEDERGSFTEFVRTPDRGQFSVNISKPGIVKGNHWHHTKNEKFLVVKGEGIIKFRKVGSDKIIEYHVTGEKLEAVDIPCGYTHSITNAGKEDMVTLMWANEAFDPQNPDTYYEEV